MLSVIAKPLYDLFKKGATFRFTGLELSAFHTIKEKLVSTPILTVYSPKLETELHCDAYSKGYGAILL